MNREHAPKFTRRAFVGGGLGLASAITLNHYLPQIRYPKCFVNDEYQDEKTCTNALVDKIRDFENEVGDKPVDFNKAKDFYIPLLTQLFIRSIPNPTKTAEQLANHIFILRNQGSKIDLELLYNVAVKNLSLPEDYSVKLSLEHPKIVQLAKDYPNFSVNQEEASQIIKAGKDATGFVIQDNIFLELDKINSPHMQISTIEYKDDTSSDPLGINLGINIEYRQALQFREQGPDLPCEELLPVVNFRSVLLHELIHFESSVPWQNLENSMLLNLQEIISTDSTIKLQSASKSNFYLSFQFKDDDEKVKTGRLVNFEEFITDYLASQISIAHGLSYGLSNSYGYPDAHANFSLILDQAQITNQELRNFHHSSQIEQFLKKLSTSFKTLGSPKQKLDAAVEVFFKWGYFEITDLKDYWPFIDSTKYDYYQPTHPFTTEINSLRGENINTLNNGCII